MLKITIEDTKSGTKEEITTTCFLGVCAVGDIAKTQMFVDCKGDVLVKTYKAIEDLKTRAKGQFGGLAEMVEISQLLSEIDELLKPDEEQKAVDDVPVVKL
ncbi:MAG: hypothetical protein RR458_03885 [Clostridia bacterium]